MITPYEAKTVCVKRCSSCPPENCVVNGWDCTAVDNDFSRSGGTDYNDGGYHTGPIQAIYPDDLDDEKYFRPDFSMITPTLSRPGRERANYDSKVDVTGPVVVAKKHPDRSFTADITSRIDWRPTVGGQTLDYCSVCGSCSDNTFWMKYIADQVPNVV